METETRREVTVATTSRASNNPLAHSSQVSPYESTDETCVAGRGRLVLKMVSSGKLASKLVGGDSKKYGGIGGKWEVDSQIWL